MTDPNQPSPPAGWYPDGQGGQRWWDGSQWTEHVQSQPQPQSQPQAPVGGETVVAPQQPQQPQQAPYQQPYQPPQQVYGQPAAQQPGLPAWQASAPGAPGSGSSGPSRNLIIALAAGGGALLLLIVTIVLVVALNGGGPEGAAKEYLHAGAEGDFAKVCELTAADERESLLDEADADDCGELGRIRREEQRDSFEDSYDYDYDDIEDSFDYDVEVLSVRERGDRRAVVRVKETTRYTGDDDFLDEVLEGEDSTTDRRSMTLVKEDGEWKVENPYSG